MKWYIQVMEKYAVFSGRAGRTEYWMFTLFNMIFAVAALLLDNLLDTTFHFSTAGGYENVPYGMIYFVYIIAVIIPSVAVMVRRLHDTGKSGLYILLNLVPLLGTSGYSYCWPEKAITGKKTGTAPIRNTGPRIIIFLLAQVRKPGVDTE